ncbi:MAG: T9SS type A sorting domain-containing protein [Candidatus Kapabacteria bacterium]|nr:T9SS type A sorting domain-containing protein [Candidatus Kapabacteria bacterium]
MKIFLTIIIAFFLVAFVFQTSFSKPPRVGQIPNGAKFSCLSCHTSETGGARNPFGKEIEKNFLNKDIVQWGSELAKLDSDGDGFTNGEELQDPNGEWKSGNSAPGNPDLVTNPGDERSKPNVNGIIDAVNSINDQYEINITQNINFSEIIISYSLNKNTTISLEIIDINGITVRFLENGEKFAGRHTNNWDGRDETGATIPNGVYFLRLSTSETVAIKKFLYER